MLAGLQDTWRPLRAQLWQQRVLLAFSEHGLHGVVLQRGLPLGESWQVQIPPQALLAGRPVLVEVLGDFVGDLLLDRGLISLPVSVALPAAAAHWRVVEWPLSEWPDDPIEALRTIQPDLGLPFGWPQISLDAQPLPGQPLRSLLVAAERSLVEAWIEVFATAGLSLDRLVPSQVCVRQALLASLEACDPDQGVVLLQPEGTACRLLLWRQGVPLFERVLAPGGAGLIAAVQRCLAFYRQQEPALRFGQLWLSEPLPQANDLAAALDLPLEQLASAPYDSLVLLGLAQAP